MSPLGLQDKKVRDGQMQESRIHFLVTDQHIYFACNAFVFHRRTDDLRAGVGGQRGQGIHSKWVRDHKEQHRQTQDAEPDPSLSPEEAAAKLQSLTLDNDESPTASGGLKRNTTGTGHSSSGSTTSSMLVRYFPQRYFILKSLTQVRTHFVRFAFCIRLFLLLSP